jgi:hypothetical protein
MPFSIRPYRRFPVHCAVTYHAGPFLKLPPAYLLGLGSLITLLLLSSGSAYAEWVSIISSESAGGYTVYVDLDTIRHEEDGVEMWELYDYKTRGTKEGYSFLSFKKRNEYGCPEERLRTLAVMHYSGSMGSGMLVSSNSDQGKWKRVPPGSVGEALWKVACNKQ